VSTLLCACSTAVVQSGVPGIGAHTEIEFLAQRAGYLDVRVPTGGRDYRFFFPDSEDCRSLIAGEGDVAYENAGNFGRLRANGLRCDAVGVLSLGEWRKTGGRRPGELIPRAQAQYRVFYRDDELALARGRFPLASRLRISGGIDLVGVLPNDPSCSAVLAATVASMEYRESGREPLVLLGGGQRCVMLGLALPLSQTKP
jgi:hypothetical protein